MTQTSQKVCKVQIATYRSSSHTSLLHGTSETFRTLIEASKVCLKDDRVSAADGVMISETNDLSLCINKELITKHQERQMGRKRQY